MLFYLKLTYEYQLIYITIIILFIFARFLQLISQLQILSKYTYFKDLTK